VYSGGGWWPGHERRGDRLAALPTPDARSRSRPESGQFGVQASLTRVGSTRSSVSSPYVTAGLLQRSDHRSVHALEADIRAWVKAWNDNPFIWTKTAGQILESLARLLRQLPAQDS
jgi:hypothetical protein